MAFSHRIRASVVQTCTQAYSLDATLDKLESLASIAKERDQSQLAVFPEAFIGGYPKHSTFGVVVGERSPEGRDEFLKYYNASIEIPSPAISRLEQISKKLQIFLVVGVIERAGGTLYCTAVFVDPEAGYVAKHRKLAPTAAERYIWGQGDGSTLPVVEAHLRDDIKANISATICWENYMPLRKYSQRITQKYQR